MLYLVLLLCLYYLANYTDSPSHDMYKMEPGNLNLAIQWYQTGNPLRNQELADSICANLKLEHFKSIHFLQRENITLDELITQINCTDISIEEVRGKTNLFQLDRKSIQVLKFNSAAADFYLDYNQNTETLSFEEAFDFANRHLQNQLVVLANLDISFDETLKELAEMTYFPPRFSLFLSRYERPVNEAIGIGTQCGPKYIGSHDAFVFRSPLPQQLVDGCRGLPLGISGTENVAMWNFRNCGYQVENPCDRIKTWHNHRSGQRTPHSYKLNNPIRSAVCYPPSFIEHG